MQTNVNLMCIIVHGDSAALAHGEVDVWHSTIRHTIFLAFTAAQHPTVPQGVLTGGLILYSHIYLTLQYTQQAAISCLHMLGHMMCDTAVTVPGNIDCTLP